MRQALIASLLALAAVLAIFALRPHIDLSVAALFYHDGFLDRSQAAIYVRSAFRVLPYLIALGFLALFLARRFGANTPYAPSGAGIFFLVAALAIGPGLIVNLGLKDHAHRPRPINVREFGGVDEFKTWYQFDGACAKNCAFPSGEAAQGFWTLAPAMLVPLPWRGPAIAAALVFGTATSVWRMAFGAHFLSDVLVGALISIIVVLVLRMRMRV